VGIVVQRVVDISNTTSFKTSLPKHNKFLETEMNRE